MTERLTDEALLPCPFCGGEAMIFRQTQACCADEECAGWTMNRCSITAWNRRAAPADDLRAENERLRADCQTLLVQLDAHQVNTGEDLEAEDRVIVEQIRAALSQKGGDAQPAASADDLRAAVEKLTRYEPAVKRDGTFSGMWAIDDGDFVHIDAVLAALSQKGGDA